jgi:hypothetical protein
MGCVQLHSLFGSLDMCGGVIHLFFEKLQRRRIVHMTDFTLMCKLSFCSLSMQVRIGCFWDLMIYKYQRGKDGKVEIKHNCLFVIYLSTRKQALRPGWQPFSKLPTDSKVYNKSRN